MARKLTLKKEYYTPEGRRIKGFFRIGGKTVPIVDKKPVTAKYVRFGEIPEDEQSANFLSLSRDKLEEVSYYMRKGLSPKEAMEKAGINPAGKFENGVSSFFLDEEGLPKIETASQLRTFYMRAHNIGTEHEPKMFSYNGGQSGTGTDGEPIVRGIADVASYTLTQKDVKRVYEKTLRTNFRKVTPMTEAEKQEYPHATENPAYKGGWSDSSIVYYDGYKYEEPEESFGATVINHRRKSFKNLK